MFVITCNRNGHFLSRYNMLGLINVKSLRIMPELENPARSLLICNQTRCLTTGEREGVADFAVNSLLIVQEDTRADSRAAA
jgi:hypothetical protein